MPISKQQFGKLYNSNKVRLTGSSAPQAEIDENYRYYTLLADLAGAEGELKFNLADDNTLGWRFAPTLEPAPSNSMSPRM